MSGPLIQFHGSTYCVHVKPCSFELQSSVIQFEIGDDNTSGSSFIVQDGF